MTAVASRPQSPHKPKVVLLGAGSLFFGRQCIRQMVTSPLLRGGTLALVDTDAERLHKMARLAAMAIAHSGAPLALEASTERKEVLPGADFVVLSFAERRVFYRGFICKLAEKHGIRMCSGDTIGPGGVIHVLRELPMILDAARDIESLCPQAWVLSYVNPTAAQGLALRRYAPKLKTLALCDGHYMPYVKQDDALKAGIVESISAYNADIDRRFDLRIAGVNHFNWMLKAAFDGRDVMPAIAGWYKAHAGTVNEGGDDVSKASYNHAIVYTLYDIFGCIPTIVSHTKEYVRYWQGLGVLPEPIPALQIWDADERQAVHDAMWQQVDGFISGKEPMSNFITGFRSDMAVDIIETMITGETKRFYINTFNDGAVANMRDDAFLELLCDVNASGAHPLPVGDFPIGLRGLQEQVLDTHELAVEGVVHQDFRLLRRALMTDPLVSSIADADAILRETVQMCRDVAPASWLA